MNNIENRWNLQLETVLMPKKLENERLIRDYNSKKWKK